MTDGPHYFHKECLEINNVVKYDKAKKMYIGIGKALEVLVRKKSHKCTRCNNPGSSI